MKSSRRVAVRPAVQIGKTQRSSFMCIHVDDDDCEHGAKQDVTLLSTLFFDSHRLRADINKLDILVHASVKSVFFLPY